MLKILDFYLDNQKSFIPKKNINCTMARSFFSHQMAPWCPNFPHQRLWVKIFETESGDFSHLIRSNSYNSNWKKVLEFRNPQEKLKFLRFYMYFQLTIKTLISNIPTSIVPNGISGYVIRDWCGPVWINVYFLS